MNENDQFYNAHIIDVLFNKYERDANDPKLKDLLIEIKRLSSPMALLNSDNKGAIQRKELVLIILPQLQQVRAGDANIMQFYSDLKRKMKESISNNAKIVEIAGTEFKNEITFVTFFYRVVPDMIDSVEKLSLVYDKEKKNTEHKFLMHTEDATSLVDLIPPRTEIEFKNLLLPYLMILNSVENGFEHYGDLNFWKISVRVNFNKSWSWDDDKVPSIHDGEQIDIFLESKSIDDFLKVDYDKLDRKNSYDENTGRGNQNIYSFINPFILHAFKKRALSFLQNEEGRELVINKIQLFLDDCFITAKQDTTDLRYRKYKEAYQSVIDIINNI